MKRFFMRLFFIIGIILLVWLILAQSCLTMRKPDAEQVETFAKKGLQLHLSILTVDGYPLHYAAIGNDSLPTLIFVHGSPGSWDAFESYMEDSALLRKFRMVSVDRPGFGYSDYGHPEHLDEQSLRISPLIEQMSRNHQPVFLAGHSLGGPMVIKLAADNDSLISGVVVISGSIDPAEEKPEKWRPVLYKTPLTYFVPGAMRPSNEELWYLKKDLVNLKSDFSRITCPVYFIHGAADPWVPPANVAYGRKMLIHASKIEVTMIPGANHFIPWTKFPEIRAVLLKLY